MKTTLFTASLVMACLLSASGIAEAATDFTATFHLSATYSSNVTCDSALKTSGDISGTEIDFGTFSSDAAEKTKHVVLTLTCDSDLPDTVKVGFKVIKPATVDGSQKNRLYPSGPGQVGSQQTILYYDWVWDEGIDKTVKSSVVSDTHKALKPLGGVDLKEGSAGDVYEVVSQDSGTKVLTFPLKITRNANMAEINKLAAGDYTAAVTVTVRYE
ncbi:hypothetical protein ACRV89_003727 [Salmonella enterica subsp. enterica serovar Newport]